MHLFLAGAVEIERGVIDAVRHRGDGVTHVALGARADRARDRRQIIDGLAPDEIAQAARRRLAGGDLGRDVAEHLLGQADIGADDCLQIGVEASFAHIQQGRDADAFLEHLARVGRPERAADVGLMRDATRPADEPPVAKHRRQYRDVRKVAEVSQGSLQMPTSPSLPFGRRAARKGNERACATRSC